MNNRTRSQNDAKRSPKASTPAKESKGINTSKTRSKCHKSRRFVRREDGGWATKHSLGNSWAHWEISVHDKSTHLEKSTIMSTAFTNCCAWIFFGRLNRWRTWGASRTWTWAHIVVIIWFRTSFCYIDVSMSILYGCMYACMHAGMRKFSWDGWRHWEHQEQAIRGPPYGCGFMVTQLGHHLHHTET